MRVVIQRVLSASVKVDGSVISSIDKGIVTLMGFSKGDQNQNVDKALAKIIDLRIFEDTGGKMNLSLKDVNGQHLIVSQFTLAGDCSQGRRPSFVNAENPESAKKLYEYALLQSTALGVQTFGGQFQADMKISLVNDGPVTFVLDF